MVSGTHPLFFWAPPPGTGLPPGPSLRRFSSPSQSSSGSSGRSVAFASMSPHYWKWFLEKKQGAGKCFVSWSQMFPTADLLCLPWTNPSAPQQGFSNWQFKSTTYSVVWVKYLSQRGKKNQALVNRGRDDGKGQGVTGRWRIFPSVRRALGLVLLKMIQNGMFCCKPLSPASVLTLHIPLSCGLVLFVLFSMTG